ncbi:MAG: hypothetical protein N4J56_002506 [Chroococcidiopsis sp. SAG 2025]|uniref:hypothetical protein n=1 Tax=Chroococcidiopsis sp. SAG 2025 TaxID=171389 RepID=UPI0029370591|nr:hypothetical protein [Chroococcidiopsis sp. SAG 2025]MDV2992852.1 hypothetical protein [Chroococcidiopsis sp. SAG 2025]
MDAQEKELLKEMLGELRVQRHRKDLDKFEKYPRLLRQLELALLIPSEEVRRKRLELLMTDLREDMAEQIKASFLDDFNDFQAFLAEGRYQTYNDVPEEVRWKVQSYESLLNEEIELDVAARYAKRLEEAKQKDEALVLSHGRVGMSKKPTPNYSQVEKEMLETEYSLKAAPSFRQKLLAEEKRLMQEYQRTHRIQTNPLTKVKK